MTNIRVASSKQKLEYAFKLFDTIQDDEAKSQYTKYLCIRVSGFLETSVKYLLEDFTQARACMEVNNYVRNQLSTFQNPGWDKILQLLATFNENWSKEYELKFGDERYKQSIGSIVGNRNKIAHGEDVANLSYIRLKDYYKTLLEVVSFIEQNTKVSNN